MSVAAVAGAMTFPLDAHGDSGGTVLALIDPVAPESIDRSLFEPHEQVFAAYLPIIAPITNNIVDDDPERYGWMSGGWWRGQVPDPFNARIQEHVATLAWFYTNDRAWNPYYHDPKLLARLDAALQYYVGLQHEDGSFPEYRWEEHGLAPTGFGSVALSATLRDLKSAVVLPERQADVEASLRLAANWLLDTSKFHWGPPITYHNQVVSGLAGVAQTAVVLGDPSIAAPLTDRCQLLLHNGQAPAGFFHEPRTSDSGYSFGVALPDLGHLYEVTGNSSVLESVRRFADWLGYITLFEPNQHIAFRVAGFDARTQGEAVQYAPKDDLDRFALGRVFLDEVPALEPFYASAQEKQASRAEWAADPAPVTPRAKGDTSPRLWMHVPTAPDGVGTAARDYAMTQLRYVKESTFTELRRGTLDQQFVFVRRPGCYTASLYGVRPTFMQRHGTDAFWHPKAGSLVLSVNYDADGFWSTNTDSGIRSASSETTVTHHAGADATAALIDPDVLNEHEGVFTSRYITTDGAVTTDVTFWQDGIRRSMTVVGGASENIPLMLTPGDVVELSDGTEFVYGDTGTATARFLDLTRGTTRLHIDWQTEREVSFAATDRQWFGGTRRHHVLTVPFLNSLITDFTAVNVQEVEDAQVTFHASAAAVPAGGSRHELAIHVVNLDSEPATITVSAGSEQVVFTNLQPGSSGFQLITDVHRVLPQATAIAKTLGPQPRVTIRRVALPEIS